jgi:hypothetical protein
VWAEELGGGGEIMDNSDDLTDLEDVPQWVGPRDRACIDGMWLSLG